MFWGVFSLENKNYYLNIQTKYEYKVNLTCPGLINEAFLREMSPRIEEDWEILAEKLNLPRSQINGFRRRLLDQPRDDVVFHMLMKWMRSLSRSDNKVHHKISVIFILFGPSLIPQNMNHMFGHNNPD